MRRPLWSSVGVIMVGRTTAGITVDTDITVAIVVDMAADTVDGGVEPRLVRLILSLDDKRG
ncbi:hypothetical protein AX768_04005 [Burkholderia sp. PAMC 28687]|nr:hypothetical protein AXG89_33980 [Burkholderia sp. PAMC 26561]AMM13398.1 hypothetical protein AX768_04005 [Burkholderia sp. PAMC 28687]